MRLSPTAIVLLAVASWVSVPCHARMPTPDGIKIASVEELTKTSNIKVPEGVTPTLEPVQERFSVNLEKWSLGLIDGNYVLQAQVTGRWGSFAVGGGITYSVRAKEYKFAGLTVQVDKISDCKLSILPRPQPVREPLQDRLLETKPTQSHFFGFHTTTQAVYERDLGTSKGIFYDTTSTAVVERTHTTKGFWIFRSETTTEVVKAKTQSHAPTKLTGQLIRSLVASSVMYARCGGSIADHAATFGANAGMLIGCEVGRAVFPFCGTVVSVLKLGKAVVNHGVYNATKAIVPGLVKEAIFEGAGSVFGAPRLAIQITSGAIDGLSAPCPQKSLPVPLDLLQSQMAAQMVKELSQVEFTIG